MPSDTTNTVVVAIQGNTIKPGTPSDGYALIYVNGNTDWEAAPPGGDLGGTFISTTVDAITGSSVVATSANKLSLLKGQNVSVSSLKTSNYTITTSDFMIGIGTLTVSITITLPSSPTDGDLYIIKDINGTCQQFIRNDTGTSTTYGFTTTISPSSGNIDGMSNIVMASPYQSITVVYTGSQWSII